MSKRRARRVGPLSVIVVLLVFSAGTRLTGTAGIAFASAEKSAPEDLKQTNVNPDTPDLDALLESFQNREAAVAEKEQKLVTRSAELERIEAEISKKVASLRESETQLRKLLAIADVAAENDVAQLTSVYENMKPKAAATVFEKMPPAFAAGFLSRMQPAAAALVMANLAPETAYAISVVFAGRNAENPSN